MPATQMTGVEEFQTRLNKAGSKLVVVDFSATWCGPCQNIAPFFETLSDRYQAEAEFLKVEVNQCPEIASSHNVMTLPTFLFFKSGQEVHRFSGSDASRLEVKVIELLGGSIPAIGASGNQDSRPDANQGLADLVTGFLHAAVPGYPTPSFKGQGIRLGDKTDVVKSQGLTSNAPATGGWLSGWFKSTQTAPSPIDAQDLQAKMNVDESLPVTQIQIRLGDGTKLTVKLNMAHPISKIRDFIIANRPEYSSSTFALLTGFPTTEITDETVSIEQANLGHTVVHQKLR